VLEAQLAHAPKDEVEAAYAGVKFREKRREVMQAWADYLDQLKAGGTESASTGKAEQKPIAAPVNAQPVAVHAADDGVGERAAFLGVEKLSQRHKPWLKNKDVQKVPVAPAKARPEEPKVTVGGVENGLSLPEGKSLPERRKPWLRGGSQ
jgi:hypothetical protein